MSSVVVNAMLDRCLVKAAKLLRQEHLRVDDESVAKVAKVAHVRGTASSSRVLWGWTNARRTLQLDLIDQPTKEANLLTDTTAYG
jgi:hypothetical protein